MKTETITALMVIPGVYPSVIELYNDAEFMRKAVGIGTSEIATTAVLQLADEAAIIYNYDAPMYVLPGNRRVGRRIISGVFYVVGIQDGKLASLSAAAIERYKARFWEPEAYTHSEVEDAYFELFHRDMDAQL